MKSPPGSPRDVDSDDCATTPAQDVEIAPAPRRAANPCPNCGDRFPRGSRGSPKLFCGQPCRRAFHKRQDYRGGVLTPFVLAWRAGRGSGDRAKDAFAELCAIADRFNAEDRAAGRPPMVDYTSALLRQGRYIDRTRS